MADDGKIQEKDGMRRISVNRGSPVSIRVNQGGTRGSHARGYATRHVGRVNIIIMLLKLAKCEYECGVVNGRGVIKIIINKGGKRSQRPTGLAACRSR
ncbi:hypothetical protein E4U54_007894 [Claviceps lovelessii]|nr:hypothetical protein E4U54_007894 [Claviceps lovelessii]